MKTQFEHKDFSQLSNDELFDELDKVVKRLEHTADNMIGLKSMKAMGVLMTLFYLIVTQIKIREPELVDKVIFDVSTKNFLKNLNIDLDE